MKKIMNYALMLSIFVLPTAIHILIGSGRG